MQKLRRIGMILVGLATLAAIFVFPLLAQDAATTPPPSRTPLASPQSVYERLGGLGTIEAMTDDFTARILSDSVVMGNRSVADALAKYDPKELHYLLVTGVCEVTGGPCRYAETRIKNTPGAHVKVRLSEREWTAGMDDLKATLAKFNVPADLQSTFLTLALAAKPKVVTGS